MQRSKLVYSAILLGAACVFSSLSAQAHCTDKGNWRLELEPFYAKATDSLLTNSIFAVKVADPAIVGDFRQQYHMDLDSDWGGRVAIGYDRRCCPNYSYGMSLEYTFLDQKNARTIFNDSRSSTGIPVLAPAEFIDITDESSARFSKASTSFSQDYDTLDLLADKKYYLCDCSVLRIFSGIRYFHLREHLHNHYEFLGVIGGGDDPAVTVHNIYHVSVKNDLNDIGPQVGASIFYHFGCGFGLTGQVATSLLYGESSSEFNNSYSLDPASVLGPVTRLTSSNHLDDSSHFTPAVSGKVGIAYRACLCNGYGVALEAGYRGDRYFNAVNDVAYQQLLAGDDINSKCNYQDYTMSGPYFSLTIRS